MAPMPIFACELRRLSTTHDGMRFFLSASGVVMAVASWAPSESSSESSSKLSRLSPLSYPPPVRNRAAVVLGQRYLEEMGTLDIETASGLADWRIKQQRLHLRRLSMFAIAL